MKLIEDIKNSANEFVDIRKKIHSLPELGYQEFATAQLICETLDKLKIPYQKNIGVTGVVAKIHKGDGKKAIGLRADIDALPIQEINQFPHHSQNIGKMHACGHDGHTAILLATAKYLQEQAKFNGTVYLIFQPAEEGGGGAKKMIDEGLFKKFHIENVYAIHNWPGIPLGCFAVSAGTVMASTSEFKITVEGRGGHAALAYLAIDPLPITCEIVLALQTIVSRNVKAVDSAVISTTIINGGQASNVIANTCEIAGTVRTFTIPVLDLIEKRMAEVASNIAKAHNASAKLEFERNYPPTINDKAQAQFCAKVVEKYFGIDKLQTQEASMGGEDFSYMLQEKPGAYILAGIGDGGHRQSGHGHGTCALHNSSYDFNDELIPIAASYYVYLVEEYFGGE